MGGLAIRASSLASVAVLALGAATAHAATPEPTVSAPLGDSGARLHHPQAGVAFDLKPYGYVEDEYLVSGTATGPGGTSAPYSARIIVRRPSSPERFNGTALVEWFNVSLGHDVDVDWINTFPEILREGYAYVGVSAQPGTTPLQAFDPVRYAGVDHPGDGYADDIFSQVGQALRAPAARNPLGKPATALIATGMSQSAERLHSYLKETQDTARVFDGFLIDRGVDEEGTIPFVADPSVPTIFALSENEAEPDQANPGPDVRVWQVPGSSHLDNWLDTYANHDLTRDVSGTEPAPWDPAAAGEWGEAGDSTGLCGLTADPPQGADQFPQRYVRDSALHALNAWIREGQAPPRAPLMQFQPGGDLIARDADGNALGGLRLPQMEVPVASYDGENCPALQGSTRSFPDDKLFSLYPTFPDYRSRMIDSARALVDRGFLRLADAADIADRVERARERWPADRRGDPLPNPFLASSPPTPQARRCLPRRASVGRRAIGTVRLGRTRRRTVGRTGVGPVRRTRRSYRWCVRHSPHGRVVAVFSRRGARGRARLVASTARRHRAGSIGPRARVARLERRFPHARRLAPGLYRAARGDRRLFGVRNGRVRFVAVARGRLVRHRAALRRYLRRAGL